MAVAPESHCGKQEESVSPPSRLLSRHPQPPSLWSVQKGSSESGSCSLWPLHGILNRNYPACCFAVSQSSSRSHPLSLSLQFASTCGGWPIPLHSEYEAPASSPRQQPLRAVVTLIRSGKVLVFSAGKGSPSSLPCSRSVGSTSVVWCLTPVPTQVRGCRNSERTSSHSWKNKRGNTTAHHSREQAQQTEYLPYALQSCRRDYLLRNMVHCSFISSGPHKYTEFSRKTNFKKCKGPAYPAR